MIDDMTSSSHETNLMPLFHVLPIFCSGLQAGMYNSCEGHDRVVAMQVWFHQMLLVACVDSPGCVWHCTGNCAAAGL